MGDMKILKRTADRLKKENHSDLALWLKNEGHDITRQGVNVWIHRRSVPNKYVPLVEFYTGIKLK